MSMFRIDMSSDLSRCSTSSSTEGRHEKLIGKMWDINRVRKLAIKGTNRVFSWWSYLDQPEEAIQWLVYVDATWSKGGKMTEVSEVLCRDRHIYRCALNVDLVDLMICGSNQRSVAWGRMHDKEESRSCWCLDQSNKVWLWDDLAKEKKEVLMVVWVL